MTSKYLNPILRLEERNLLIENALIDLKEHVDKFDAFVCRGFSSTIPSSILAHFLNKKIVISRKENTDSHGMINEGESELKCVFIDDFICSGKTLKAIYKTVSHLQCELYGVWFYSQEKETIQRRLSICGFNGVKVLNNVSSKQEQSHSHHTRHESSI